MFKRFSGKFSSDLGIDLGTANTLIYHKDKGIVVNEPSVVSLNSRNGQIIAVGHTAKEMIGKTPGHIVTVKPLVSGIISDFEVTEKMLRYFIEKIHRESFLFTPCTDQLLFANSIWRHLITGGYAFNYTIFGDSERRS